MVINPYGGRLVNLLFSQDERKELVRKAISFPSIVLSSRSVCDLELLATGAFSPLNRFMGKDDYNSVLNDWCLTSGIVFPIPITLPVHKTDKLKLDKFISLRSPRNDLLAVMRIEEVYRWNYKREVKSIYQTTDTSHPVVAEMAGWGQYYISGELKVLNLPVYFDYLELRLTPLQTRKLLTDKIKSNVVAFQTRNPMHRVHEEMVKIAIEKINGVLFLHPVVGMTKPGDINCHIRIRCYKELVKKYFNSSEVILSLLPLAMRFAGPRAAVWHAIIRRNYGANFFIVGRDHASPGYNFKNIQFYQPYEAQENFQKYSSKIGVKMIPFKEFVYSKKYKKYLEIDKISINDKVLSISGSKIRNKYLNTGKRLPKWFTRPEIARILQEAYPPFHKRGFCVWFTGLPCSGKSTIAEILVEVLTKYSKEVTLLDGDIIRNNLSQGLGFSKKDRNTNILRIGYVASEIVRHKGIAVCAAISPYEIIRNEVRNLVGENYFILVHVDTSLKVCENRDVKGLYRQARRGLIKNFTGVGSVYEKPQNAEITLRTIRNTPIENVNIIIKYLKKRGFIHKINHLEE